MSLAHGIIALALVVFGITGALSNRRWLRRAIVLTMLVAGALSLLSLTLAPRVLQTHRVAQGKWNQEYADGVLEMAKFAQAYEGYLMISIAALTAMALRALRRSN